MPKRKKSKRGSQGSQSPQKQAATEMEETPISEVEVVSTVWDSISPVADVTYSMSGNSLMLLGADKHDVVDLMHMVYTRLRSKGFNVYPDYANPFTGISVAIPINYDMESILSAIQEEATKKGLSVKETAMQPQQTPVYMNGAADFRYPYPTLPVAASRN